MAFEESAFGPLELSEASTSISNAWRVAQMSCASVADLLLQSPQKGLCVAYATAVVSMGVVWQLRPGRPYKQATTDLAQIAQLKSE